MVEEFDVCETPVAEIHDAIVDGRLTCEALVERQNTPGPMARTVTDLALVFDAIVGFDPEDRATAAAAVADAPDSYADDRWETRTR